MEESRNWLEMLDEQMVNIFQRLRTVQLLKSARKVCTNWRRICKDPAVWKVINIDKSVDAIDGRYDLEKVTKEAVDLSCGELIDISIEGFGTDDLLDYIVQRSSKVKHLCLNCIDMTGSGMSRAVKRLPQLEELRLKLIRISAEDIEVIGRNCPELKTLMVDKGSTWPLPSLMNSDDDDDDDDNDDAIAIAIAKSMPDLRHLQLLGSEITNDGLQAIRDGCPHLRSLDVQKSSNLDYDEMLILKCIQQMEDYNLFSADEDDFSNNYYD